MTRKNQAHALWAGVSATSPGVRNDSVACSRPRQPRKFHRPKAANKSPMPPRSAIRESTLHTTTLAVGSFSTSGSGGQLAPCPKMEPYCIRPLRRKTPCPALTSSPVKTTSPCGSTTRSGIGGCPEYARYARSPSTKKPNKTTSATA